MVDLDALERLHEAATPGEWRWTSNGSDPQLEGGVEYPEMSPVLVASGCGNKTATDSGVLGCMGDKLKDPLRSCPLHPTKADRDLICAARNALPDLLRELREARGIIERFRVGDLEFDLMQTEEGDCWTDSLVMANKWLRAALSRETTGGGE
jgi:hypothetical protein